MVNVFLVFGFVVNMFEYRNMDWVWLVHVNGIVLLNFHFVRFLNVDWHQFFNMDGHFLFDFLWHQLVDWNRDGLGYMDVNGIGLGNWNFDHLGNWYSYRMRNRNSNFFSHVDRYRFGLFDVFGGMVDFATSFVSASSTSLPALVLLSKSVVLEVVASSKVMTTALCISC